MCALWIRMKEHRSESPVLCVSDDLRLPEDMAEDRPQPYLLEVSNGVPYPIKGFSYIGKESYCLFLGFEALRDKFDLLEGLLESEPLRSHRPYSLTYRNATAAGNKMGPTVTVPSDFLFRDDYLKESSIGKSFAVGTPRVPSG
ncbi:hypothetical protein EVAR_44613_1 [Eumeta japonica]|uniref:Uncharacterized protein n=1 Tax=Eumeta variegata TaxID=151549 RepID=A0A4C1X8U6_EUMVA|nr:hypothetical protein EVAR_44613_1 [Eumeta japonica]